MQTTSDTLKRWQSSQQLTQSQAAQRLGASLRNYGRWVRGLSKPSPIWQEKIDQATAQTASNQ
jgi:transcriptional regulator with XRE-family HTH domain